MKFLLEVKNFDLVKFITMNQVNIWTRIIYCIIAIAGIINIILLFMNLSEPMETKIEKVK